MADTHALLYSGETATEEARISVGRNLGASAVLRHNCAARSLSAQHTSSIEASAALIDAVNAYVADWTMARVDNSLQSLMSWWYLDDVLARSSRTANAEAFFRTIVRFHD